MDVSVICKWRWYFLFDVDEFFRKISIRKMFNCLFYVNIAFIDIKGAQKGRISSFYVYFSSNYVKLLFLWVIDHDGPYIFWYIA